MRGDAGRCGEIQGPTEAWCGVGCTHASGCGMHATGCGMHARVAYIAVADELDIPRMLTEGPDGRRRAHVDLGHIMRE